MTKTEKQIVLLALVSEIRFADLSYKKHGLKIDLESEHIKGIRNTFSKLNKQYFKNDEIVLKANEQYLETILEEIKGGI